VSKYIKAYLSAIPSGQRDAIQSILDKQRDTGEISTSEEYEQALQALLALLQAAKDFAPGFKPEPVDERRPTRISSRLLNDSFTAMCADLGGLYEHLNRLDRTITVHANLRRSDWTRIRDAINKTTEDLACHRYLKLTDDWQDVKYVDFWNNRVGEPTNRAAAIDPETKRLTLGVKEARHIERYRGPTQTRAEVYDISVTEAEGSSSDLKPENALDANDRTFWAHLLLTDSKVTTTWDGVDYPGALVGYTVLFSNAEFVNYVSFLPFSNFPLQLVDLQYRDGSTWATVPGFVAPDAGLDWAEVRFQRVQANALRFVFYQENFTQNKYLVPKQVFSLAKLWDQVVDDELLRGVDEEDITGHQQTQIETNPRFRAYLTALKDTEDRLDQTGIVRGVLEDHENVGRALDSVTQVIADTREDDGLVLKNVVQRDTDAPQETDSDLLSFEKVEYLFGLRNIRIRDNNYLPIGVYHSPKFVQRAVPYQVALDTTASHVSLSGADGGSYRDSSIEYEMEFSPDRRHAILPYGSTQVTSELVAVHSDTLTGTLRFTPNGAVALRASGKLLTNGVDYSVVGTTVSILQGFSPNYRYTATYTPAANQDIIDLETLYDSAPLVEPDRFAGTDAHGMVDLTYYPYVSYEIVNSDNAWSKVDGDGVWLYRMPAGNVTIDGIAYGPASGLRRYEPLVVKVNGARALNITDYRGRTHPGFRNDPDTPYAVQYIHAGKRLYFSRPLENASIEVEYRWMVQYIRLNATLRGHKFVVNSYTPVVSDYKVLIRSGI